MDDDALVTSGGYDRAMMNFWGSTLWERWLLEQPWPVVGVLMLLALVLVATGQQRRDRRLLVLAAAAGLLAVGVYLLSVLVETATEIVIRQTRELVTATAPVDPQVLQRHLDPQVSLLGPVGDVWLESGTFLPVLQRAARMYNIKSNTPAGIELMVNQQGIRVVQLRVRSVMEAGALAETVPTVWQLTWVRMNDDHWRVTSVQWLGLWNQAPNQNYLMR